MSNETPSYFADAVTSITHVNGVYRITFAQQITSDNMEPVAQMLIPANQLGVILNGIGQAAENITAKLKQDQETAPAKKAPAKKAAAKKKAPAKSSAKK